MRAPQVSRDLTVKDREMSLDLPYIAELKASAKKLRVARGISHSHALEFIATSYGFKDWNTLVALAGPQPPVRIGQRISGWYLKVPFTGRVLSVKPETAHLFRVNVEFDLLIDVIPFESMSNFKNRANKAVDQYGISPDQTSDGAPHMILDI